MIWARARATSPKKGSNARGVQTAWSVSERQRTAKQAPIRAPMQPMTTRLIGMTPPKASGR